MTISMVLMIMIGTKAINNINYRTTVRAFITINSDSNNKNDTSFSNNNDFQKTIVIKKSKPVPSNQMVPVSNSKTKQSPRSPPQTDPLVVCFFLRLRSVHIEIAIARNVLIVMSLQPR